MNHSLLVPQLTDDELEGYTSIRHQGTHERQAAFAASLTPSTTGVLPIPRRKPFTPYLDESHIFCQSSHELPRHHPYPIAQRVMDLFPDPFVASAWCLLTSVVSLNVPERDIFYRVFYACDSNETKCPCCVFVVPKRKQSPSLPSFAQACAPRTTGPKKDT